MSRANKYFTGEVEHGNIPKTINLLKAHFEQVDK